MTTPNTEPGERMREQQLEEYGTYVATQQIYVDGALAYNEGDPVPVSNVREHGYVKAGLVKKTAEK